MASLQLSVLTCQNKFVLEEAERILKNFKPVTYDAGQQVKAIESFEAAAVRERNVEALTIR